MVSVQIKVSFPLYMQTRKKTERKEVERMKRRFAAALMACFMAVALVVPASAVQTRAARNVPKLDFDGTEAVCKFGYTKMGASISATMELWCGSAPEVIWTGRDKNTLDMSKTHTVRRGQTYTLKVSCTVNGETTKLPPITKTCP